MGIPHFYSWLCRRYPLIKQMYQAEQASEIDFFYIDLNSILYRCVREEAVMFIDFVSPKKQNEIWNTLFEYLDSIIDMVSPQKMLFIAIDGVCPRVKMNQQRTRRYLAGKGAEQSQKNFSEFGKAQTADFQCNSITPGTNFMSELNEMLKYFIQKKIKTDEKWKKIQVIFSGSDQPGEGEHKIVQFIREIKKRDDYDENWTHCFFSPDADMIILGLLTRVKNVVILRQTFQMSFINQAANRFRDRPGFELVYLNIVREYMEQEFKELKNVMQNLKFDINAIIDDFVFLFYFIGNDFLPRMYCFDIRNENLEKLLAVFSQYYVTATSYINQNGNLQIESFKILLNQIVKLEYEFLQDKAQNGYNEDGGSDEEDQSRLDQIQKDQLFLKSLNRKYQQDKCEAKRFYYQEKFNYDIANQEGQLNVEKLCEQYLIGLQFVLKYYYQNVADWTWYYPYYYSPMASDLIAFIIQRAPSNYTFTLNPPFKPFQQLLTVLPPVSSNLLPEPYEKLLTDLKGQLRCFQPDEEGKGYDYCPKEYEVDAYGAIFESAFIAILPFMPNDLIHRVYQGIDQSVLSQKQMKRNEENLGLIYTFKEDAKEVEVRNESFKGFKVRVDIQKFDLYDVQIKFQKNAYEKEFPNLSLLQNKECHLKTLKQRQKVTVQLQMQINVSQEKIPVSLDQVVYVNFPHQIEGQIVGILTKENLLQTEDLSQITDFQPYDFKSHDVLFKQISNKIKDEYKQLGIIFDRLQQIVFVKVQNLSYRNIENKILFKYKYVVQPQQLLTYHKKVQYYNSYEQKQEIDQRIFVLSPQYIGYKGYIQKIDGDTITVKIKENNALQKKILQENSDPFFDIQQVSKDFGLSIYQMISLLGSITIKLPSKEKLDIGLNLIHQAKNLIVPQLIRCDYSSGDFRFNQSLQYVQISSRCLDLVQKYVDVFPQVLNIVKYENPLNINSQKIFGEYHIQKAFKIYVWVLQQESTSLKFQPVNSKFAPEQEINFTRKKNQYLTVDLHKNDIFSIQYRSYTPPYFKEQIKFPSIGDTVYNLKKYQNYAKFGEVGVVIGVANDFCECLFSHGRVLRLKHYEIWNRKWKREISNDENWDLKNVKKFKSCFQNQVSHYEAKNIPEQKNIQSIFDIIQDEADQNIDILGDQVNAIKLEDLEKQLSGNPTNKAKQIVQKQSYQKQNQGNKEKDTKDKDTKKDSNNKDNQKYIVKNRNKKQENQNELEQSNKNEQENKDKKVEMIKGVFQLENDGLIKLEEYEVKEIEIGNKTIKKMSLKSSTFEGKK